MLRNLFGVFGVIVPQPLVSPWTIEPTRGDGMGFEKVAVSKSLTIPCAPSVLCLVVVAHTYIIAHYLR